MLKVGLTGGIGSGKSAVSSILRELGAHIIDADVLAREALEPDGPAYHRTVCLFGKRVLGSDGRIDRKALADIVFQSPEKRAALEAIVHPVVFEEEERAYARVSGEYPGSIVVFDAALLIEAGAHRRMDEVVVVWCRPETQLARLVERGGLTPGEAALRINAQMPLEEKKKYATRVIDNDGSIEETGRQVRAAYIDFKTKV